LILAINEIVTITNVIVMQEIDANDSEKFRKTLLKASRIVIPKILNSFI